MLVSVIIPTRDRWDTLARTLPSVLGQECAGAGLEVIVVDDGSAGKPRAVAGDVRMRLLRQDPRGPAAARNRGLAAARGGLVLFLDDDILCAPGLLAAHLAAHRAGDERLTCGPVHVAPSSPDTLVAAQTGKWYESHWRRIAAQGGPRPPRDGLLAANIAIPRATLAVLGGFDETLAGHEDTELGLRLWKRGTPMLFVGDAVAYELFVKPSRQYAVRDGYAWGRAEVQLCRKHPEWRPHSGLAAWGGTPRAAALARRALVALPAALHSCLLPLHDLADRAAFPRRLRGPMTRLLQLQHRLAFLQGACREAGGAAAVAREFGLRLPILLYHRVGEPRADLPATLTTTPAALRRHLRWLRWLGYHAIAARDWAAWCRHGRPLPRRPVVLTFDDAYDDTGRLGLPLLKEARAGATVFVVTGQLGGTNAWDAPRGVASLALMGAEAIRAWAREGIEFGAHTRSHGDLTQLAPAAVDDEVAGSRADLEAVLGCTIESFAYPYGFHDATAAAAAKERYAVAITCDEGLNTLATDPRLLRRTLVEPGDSFIDFAGRLWLGYSPWNRLRARMAIRRRLRRLLGTA